MFEDIEGIYIAPENTEQTRPELTPQEAAYINECVEYGNASSLVDRIDEMSTYQPPKAIDSDPAVAEIIEPVIDQIDTKYLEAPSDIEQVTQIGEYLAEIDDLKFDNWTELTFEQRAEVLQEVENKIAEIEHREPCQLKFQEMDACSLGAFSNTNKDITINSLYVASDNFYEYKEMLDTLIHEGRHAYQDYNVTTREVNGDPNVANEWSENFDFYISPDWDFQAYYEQPVEQDARDFANDVLTEYFENIA